MSIVVKWLDGATCHLVWTMEVPVGPDHIVLDGNPASPQGEQQPLNFGRCLLWPNGWMDQNATWYGGRLSAGDIVLDDMYR